MDDDAAGAWAEARSACLASSLAAVERINGVAHTCAEIRPEEYYPSRNVYGPGPRLPAIGPEGAALLNYASALFGLGAPPVSGDTQCPWFARYSSIVATQAVINIGGESHGLLENFHVFVQQIENIISNFFLW